MPQTMHFGKIKVVRQESDNLDTKVSYKAWETYVDADPLTGELKQRERFLGQFFYPAKLFRALAEIAV